MINRKLKLGYLFCHIPDYGEMDKCNIIRTENIMQICKGPKQVTLFPGAEYPVPVIIIFITNCQTQPLVVFDSLL